MGETITLSMAPVGCSYKMSFFIEASPVYLILNVNWWNSQKNTFVWCNLITFMVGFIDLFIPHLSKWYAVLALLEIADWRSPTWL